jgi:hypothetical protein
VANFNPIFSSDEYLLFDLLLQLGWGCLLVNGVEKRMAGVYTDLVWKSI